MTPKTRLPLRRALAALALALPLAATAVPTLELGQVTIVEGASGELPFTLTLDQDLTLVAIDAWVTFDTTRIAFDPFAVLYDGLSLAGLASVPGFDTAWDDEGFVIAGAPRNPVRNPFVMPADVSYAGTLRFTGLQVGVVPVSARLQLCDLDSCFFGDPIEPITLLAQGQVTVTPVPEPAPWLLLAGGLLAVGRLASRRGR